MYLFKFRLTTESRILTHGPSARSLNCVLFCGIEEIVRLTLGEGASSYHLHGFEANLNLQVRRYTVTVSLLCYISESASAPLMEDARVAPQAEHIKGIISSEADYIYSLSSVTWQRLADIIRDGTSADELKTDVMFRSHTLRAFMFKRVFSKLDELPWSLAQGDVATNVSQLTMATASRDPHCSLKILQLREMGFNLLQ